MKLIELHFYDFEKLLSFTSAECHMLQILFVTVTFKLKDQVITCANHPLEHVARKA